MSTVKDKDLATFEALDRTHIQSSQIQNALCEHYVYENDPVFKEHVDKAVEHLEAAYQHLGQRLDKFFKID